MNGILVIDKPQDYTSFDVVAIVRGLLRQKKIGHTGTLDPMATGVLPLLLGSAARAQPFLPKTDKEYLAEFQLGITTDTQDITGRLLSKKEFHGTAAEVSAALSAFRGEILQVPPMYSAVWKDGVRLYDLARQGITVEREARPITVHTLELLSFEESAARGRLRVKCSKGTYIRTLCEDIGNALGCGGVLLSLRRTEACGYTLKDCLPLEEARRLIAEGKDLAARILPTESLFAHLPILTVTKKQTVRFANGGNLALERVTLPEKLPEDGLLRVYGADKGFLGIAKPDAEKGELAVVRLFCGEEGASS